VLANRDDEIFESSQGIRSVTTGPTIGSKSLGVLDVCDSSATDKERSRHTTGAKIM
jgi:hypothetical protein